MSQRQSSLVTDTLKEVQAALSRVGAELKASPEHATSVAMHELATANQALARVLGLLGDSPSMESSAVTPLQMSSTLLPNYSRISLLEVLKLPVTALELTTRASKVVSKLPLLLLKGQIPVGFQWGCRCVGELVQLDESSLRSIRGCGAGVLDDIEAKLSHLGVRLGFDLTDEELRFAGFRRIKSGLCILEDRGGVDRFADGTLAVSLGATNVLRTPVSTLIEIPREQLTHFEKIVVLDARGTERPLSTIGDLVQLPMKTAGSPPGHGVYVDPSSIERLLDTLLPKGLCMNMRIADLELALLGIPRVRFQKDLALAVQK